MDYKARFYSPALGKFTQPDTLIPGMGNPQNWNRFSYVGNNPINYNDPTGHIRVEDDGGGSGSCTNVNCLPPPPVDPGDYCDTHPGHCGGSSGGGIGGSSGGIPNTDVDDYGIEDFLSLTSVSIPFDEFEVCQGHIVAGKNCMYGSMDITFSTGEGIITFSPDVASTVYGDYMFSTNSFGFGFTSISSNLDISTWMPISSTENHNSKFGYTSNFDTVKLAIEASGHLDNQYASGNVRIGLNVEIRPRNTLIALGVVAIPVVLYYQPQLAVRAAPVIREGICAVTEAC